MIIYALYSTDYKLSDGSRRVFFIDTIRGNLFKLKFKPKYREIIERKIRERHLGLHDYRIAFPQWWHTDLSITVD